MLLNTVKVSRNGLDPDQGPTIRKNSDGSVALDHL